MNIYVKNVDFAITQNQLREIFEEFGEVKSVKIVTDYVTGKSRGFGFVEMANDDEAKAAIENLNGAEVNERPLTVTVARPRTGGTGGGGGERGGQSRNQGYRNSR